MKANVILLALVCAFFFSCANKESLGEQPLPEHPRPDFQRPVWQNLNGYWQFKADSTDVGLTENWQNETESFNQEILVPFSWAAPLSEIEMPNLHVGWYYRSINLEDSDRWRNKNKHLVFGASDFNTTVWLNGV
ncbi:MAG TPA: hypothetical protein VKA10_11240, partial [Prolixibacteraceae bacterium]|nr:hypothetical protein [Prolixibacteraceae bacterium]